MRKPFDVSSVERALKTSPPGVAKLGHEFDRWFLRGAVLGLQVVGSFPFRWSGPPHRPAFSAALCLWSVSLSMFLAVGVYLKVGQYLMTPHELESEELNTTIVYIRKFSEYTGTYVVHLFMLARSRKLARVLEQVGDLLERKDVEIRSEADLWKSCLTVIGVLSVWGSHQVIEATSIPLLISRLMVMSYSILSLIGVFFQFAVFKILCTSVSKVLVDAVKGLTDVHPALSLDARESFRLTENEIRKIDRLRLNIASCFLEPTSIYVIVTMVSSVVFVYTVSVYGLQDAAVLPAMSTFFFAFNQCNIGQNFEDKVETAVEKLRDFRCEVTDAEVQGLIDSLQRSLEPLHRFSMCGWYNLNKTLLLTMGGLVMTNLVVLFQVGNPNATSC